MAGDSGPSAVVIEDDDSIRQLIGAVLEQIGLSVVAVGDGAEGVQAVADHQPVVVTLDVNMPGIDGFETAKRIRAISSSYIVMITARDEEIDALQGLGSGADDFVLKPFRPRELRARIEAMLRRPRTVELPPVLAATAEAPRIDPDAVVLRHGALVVDTAARLVELDGEQVDLTRSEFELLTALLESGRTVRTKAELAVLLRGESYLADPYVSDADRRGVEVHIGNLRKKLADDAAHPRIIETVRGVGYRLTAPRG
ncbi:response regulator transcription factor [Gryllotalpicola ginsengisoli]|uniref:response regulator transcription factor n=1 Tax=Gryllotalpicola ginsengisoli TaxID=444608 RepID=UPI0003B5C540|nr:response regulator transcription factor [Gryllotalpicola ginsengisoli]